jgi:hypothetical protein
MVRPVLESLNLYAVTTRYPRAFATKHEASDAVKAMKQVKEFTRGKLGAP